MLNKNKFIDKYGCEGCPKKCGDLLRVSWYKNTQTVRCNSCNSEFYEEDDKLKEINKKDKDK